jgi:signal transduction histidine kinase
MITPDSVVLPESSVIHVSEGHRRNGVFLHQSQEKISLLAGRLIDGQEEERKRISRELHDGLGQDIAALAMKIDLIRMRSAATETGLELRELQQQVVLLGHKIRLISHNLHPATLKHLGLTCALNALCSEFQQEGLSIRLVLPEERPPLDEQTQLCIFRIAQEALRNIVRHAHCSSAYVKLHLREHSVVLTIKDRGTGFDFTRGHSGLGLISIHERVRLIRGSLELQSAPGIGTTIRVTVPLPGNDRHRDIFRPGKARLVRRTLPARCHGTCLS